MAVDLHIHESILGTQLITTKWDQKLHCLLPHICTGLLLLKRLVELFLMADDMWSHEKEEEEREDHCRGLSHQREEARVANM